jgi:hypothetical protein
MGEHEPRDTKADQLADQRLDRGWGGSSPREGGQAFGPRVEPDRQPVPGDRQACPQVVGPIGDGGRQDHAGSAGRERELDRFGRIEATGELQRDGST